MQHLELDHRRLDETGIHNDTPLLGQSLHFVSILIPRLSAERESSIKGS
jgi:hypothetical protein